MSVAMMERVRELIEQMRATKRYHEERLDARLFFSKYRKGTMIFEFDRTIEPWRLIGVIGLWETKDPEVFEVGTFYVHPDYERKGVGGKLFEKVLRIAPDGVTLITIMRGMVATNIAIKRGFQFVSKATARDVEEFCGQIGFNRRAPGTAYSRMVRPTHDERWLLRRPVKGSE